MLLHEKNKNKHIFGTPNSGKYCSPGENLH